MCKLALARKMNSILKLITFKKVGCVKLIDILNQDLMGNLVTLGVESVTNKMPTKYNTIKYFCLKCDTYKDKRTHLTCQFYLICCLFISESNTRSCF